MKGKLGCVTDRLAEIQISQSTKTYSGSPKRKNVYNVWFLWWFFFLLIQAFQTFGLAVARFIQFDSKTRTFPNVWSLMKTLKNVQIKLCIDMPHCFLTCFDYYKILRFMFFPTIDNDNEKKIVFKMLPVFVCIPWLHHPLCMVQTVEPLYNINFSDRSLAL